jgi:hypothetical protein
MLEGCCCVDGCLSGELTECCRCDKSRREAQLEGLHGEAERQSGGESQPRAKLRHWVAIGRQKNSPAQPEAPAVLPCSNVWGSHIKDTGM